MSPDALLAEIEDFLRSCRQPAALEPGQPPFPLHPDSHTLSLSQSRLLLEVWDDKRHLARRLRSIEEQRPGRLRLSADRFGGKSGSLFLVDLAHARSSYTLRSGERSVFLEEVRRFLARQYPRARVRELTCGTDLQHSLSPSFPRALVTHGARASAVLAAPPDHADGALSFGLIWLDYLRRLHPQLTIDELALFLPLGRHSTTCIRLKHLDPSKVRPRLFLYDQDGFERPVDPADHGNLDTQLFPAAQAASPPAFHPEARLEAAVRGSIGVIDAGLLPSPIYGQVCALAGLERGLLDLLAVDRTGRLAVIELKATEDLHLPLQALDYWIRVAWHAARGEFRPAAYFPGIELRPDPPLLFLVAPALHFHPATETVLRFFHPSIPVERVGLSVEWQQSLRVAFRATGSARPDRRAGS